MISAPVGFQCPDCVNAQTRSLPKTQAVGSGLWATIPFVTRYIIGTCIAVYGFAWYVGLTDFEYFVGMSPLDVAAGQWWRLITATFMHANLMHIVFNMYALLVLGSSLERMLGPIRFAAIYFMAALGGSVAALMFADLQTISVGASGAIFGLMTATIVVGRHIRVDTRQIMFWLVLNIVFSFLAPGIDWRAHLGGALLGAVTAHVLVGSSRQSQKSSAQWITVGLILLVMVVEILVRVQQLSAYLGG